MVNGDYLTPEGKMGIWQAVIRRVFWHKQRSCSRKERGEKALWEISTIREIAGVSHRRLLVADLGVKWGG